VVEWFDSEVVAEQLISGIGVFGVMIGVLHDA